jgi:adenylate cyclase
MTDGQDRGRLDSWKEIAAYLNRGARTVQRWEREEGLPVHRLRHDQGSTVFAHKEELDAWWASRQTELSREPSTEGFGSSVAVLPFADMSPLRDQAYFCEGIAEEILNALSQLQGLRVASRMSSFSQKTDGCDSREIGHRLRVGALLEGSVRKCGSRLRITAELVDVETGYQLWSGRYDRELQDVFAIQEEIARSIAEALEVRLTRKEREALKRPHTGNLDAYECYLRGRKCFYQYGPRDMEFARQLFERAIELDPGFAPAYAGVADCWSYLYLYSERSERSSRAADAASQRAIELEPGSAQAHASRGVALSIAERDAEAEAAFERAIELDPKLFEARYFYARHAFTRGHLELALTLYEAAMQIRPEDYQAPLLMAQIYDDLGRNEEGTTARRRGIEAADEHLKLNPDDARAVYAAANGLAALGERERARQWADRAVAMRPDDPVLLYNVGCIYSLIGQGETALDVLERVASHGLIQRGWLEHDSNLDPLRGHPRFEALRNRLRL